MIYQMLLLAFRSITRNKARSFLTMLGIVIGIASVSVMVSYGQGMQKQIEARIRSMGVNLLTIFPSRYREGRVSMGGANRLTYSDYETLRRETMTLSGLTPVVRWSGTIATREQSYSTTVYGVSADFVDIRSWSMREGEFFSEEDVRRGQFVCVLGNTTSKELFGEDVSPVGQTIRIANSLFQVVGVLAQKGSSGPEDQDDLVVIPYTTFRMRINQSPYVQQIMVSSLSRDMLEQSIEEISTILRKAHRLSVNQSNDFRIVNQSEMLETAQSVSSSLTVFLVSIAAISLLVGGIGIMNIMLVSVVERTREIGIRMAVGARQEDILLQFLIESVVLCLMGGGVGLLVGIIVSLALKIWLAWSIAFSWPVFLLSFVLTFLIGVGFGYYPARRAAFLNPIEALKYE